MRPYRKYFVALDAKLLSEKVRKNIEKTLLYGFVYLPTSLMKFYVITKRELQPQEAQKSHLHFVWTFGRCGEKRKASSWFWHLWEIFLHFSVCAIALNEIFLGQFWNSFTTTKAFGSIASLIGMLWSTTFSLIFYADGKPSSANAKRMTKKTADY